MKFSIFGEIYASVDEARAWRRRSVLDKDWPETVTLTLSTHNEFDRELVRKYPIQITIRAYEITRKEMEWARGEFSLYPTSTKTGGVIGGDGGFGWAPAVNFEHEPDAYNGTFGSAYVVPWPETVRPITHGHDWERVARAVVSAFS